ncbi:hypothetical protein KY495_10820 [Massilia sp. PAMC28688]|uniref:hypothetical protein n=1 Tax=Massilia sp. PAMC28688 TaxID=2861283 RepID=UPI001C6288F0|nr:hypothetical protein [Massilia sp. PAMC28688]QYF95592.1 hypothetical protein KY495_10820 [Massilia sp. PAMC28688]
MAPLITLALKLAPFAPGILKLITGNDKASEVATHVIDIAKVVTGAKEPDNAVAIIKEDPILALQFKLAMEDRHQALANMYLVDTQNARARDVQLALAGQKNHRANALAAGPPVPI